MEDLGDALTGDTEVLMLGGGNPAHIPEVQSLFQERMQWLLNNPSEFTYLIGNYDSPRGEAQFIQVLTDFFNRHYGWKLRPENIVLTAGSQSAFFLLFNLFAGEFPDGSQKQILLPTVPEYIGYADVGLSDNLFLAHRPLIETFDDHTFKYHIDFEKLIVDEGIAAICVSRPTNPSGNVLSDDEIRHLRDLATKNQVPLIIDNAYGMPFPNIIFTEASMEWSENVIYCMSLSKLGLPAVRTGIVIAREEITEAVVKMNGIINLALGSVGPALVIDLFRTDKILELSEKTIKPFYKNKATRAIAIFHQELKGLEYYIHKAEGALFLWLWFPNLPITSEELYKRLKSRGVLVLSGHYFFPGLNESWQHQHECLRVSYAMDDKIVSEGIKVIADEVKRLFSGDPEATE